MTPNRIAYVINVFPKLSETFIAQELLELVRRGVEVRILSLRRPQEELHHAFIAESGLDQLVEYDPAKFLPLLHEFRPQLLHAHFATEPTAAARALATQLRAPFTFTAHGYDIHRKPPADFGERAMAARRLITVSEANAEFITSTFHIPRNHIRVIPCGVDTEFFVPQKTDIANTRHLGSDPVRIVCVARHVKVKNLGYLLRACARLRDRKLGFQCMLIGDGPLRTELEACSEELKLKSMVRFAGMATRDQVLQEWQRADIAVLSSENEGMPVCLMEAAACGVPAVAPAVGGIPELIENGVTGLLANSNGDDLADMLQRLIEDPELRTRLGGAARDRARKVFSVTKNVDQLMSIWREILA